MHPPDPRAVIREATGAGARCRDDRRASLLRVPVATIPLTCVGWKAEAALTATRGRARVLASLSTSLYLTAADQVIWLGRPGSVLHPRAMASPERLGHFPSGAPIGLDLAHARPWPARHPVPLANRSLRTATARALLAMLREHPERLPPPGGLGTLLVGQAPPFPLEGAVPAVLDLALACDADRVTEAAAAAHRLLGLGPGLTPSGDDFVGGVLFTRTHESGAAGVDWRQANAKIIARARQRTNPISFALLADLADGYGYEPLHELAEALEDGTAGDPVVHALRRLVRLGHSSGWDLLAGFLVGLVGIAALGRR